MPEEKPKPFSLYFKIKSTKAFKGSDGKMLTEAQASIETEPKQDLPPSTTTIVAPLTQAGRALITGAKLKATFEVAQMPKPSPKQEAKQKAAAEKKKTRVEAALTSLLGKKDGPKGIIPEIEEKQKLISGSDKKLAAAEKKIANAKGKEASEKAKDEKFELEQEIGAAQKQLGYLNEQKSKKEEELASLDPTHEYFGREKE